MEKVAEVIAAPATYGYKFLFKAFKFITGKDSVAFAWMMVLLVNAYTFTYHALNHTAIIFKIIDVAWLMWMVHITKEYDRHTKGSTKMEVLTKFRWLDLCCFYVIMFSALMVFDLLLFAPLAALDTYLSAVWALSLCIYSPGGKSVFAKAKEKIASIHFAKRPAFAPIGV